MSETDYNCPHCNNPDPIPVSVGKCPACNHELVPPNMRACETAVEIGALERRIQIAETESNARNCRAILEDFANAVSRSKAVICRPLGHLVELVSSPNSLFQNFYQQLEGERRLPEDNDFDRQREAVDSMMFPSYRRDIVFGALSLNGRGPQAYGPHSIVLREMMIAHRASVFEENSLVFIRRNRLSITDEVPPGHRAVWGKRADLAKAKLHAEIDISTAQSSYPEILLSPGGSTDGGDFIEVHIYQSFNRRAIEKIVLGKLENSADKVILKSLKRKLNAANIDFEEV